MKFGKRVVAGIILAALVLGLAAGCGSPDRDFSYTEEAGEITITRYNGKGGDAKIPSEIDGKKVTSILDRAFRGCEALTSITIPDSVTSIGIYAFHGCSSLTSITIPDGVKSIGEYTFSECSSLTSVTIPESVTSIGIFSFGFCSSLKSITIPESVTSIGDYAFCFCTSLTSITIPESVTSIGRSAFSLSVTNPDSVTDIGEWLFGRRDRMVIHCSEDSYAHQYAVDNRFRIYNLMCFHKRIRKSEKL